MRTAILRGGLVISLTLVAGVSAPAYAEHQPAPTLYTITELGSLGGTSSAGSSINNQGWVAGFSNLPGDGFTHATLWRDGSARDLGTLGGPNSAVLWPVKNNRGIVVGVAETADMDPRRELWSCSFFFPGGSTGHVCRGFVWRDGQMHALPTLGGTHGFAAGANNRGSIAGWAETAVEDPSCNPPQVLGFRGVMWSVDGDLVRELPPLAGDTASAATAINNRGQVVGISGACADSVGGLSARHAVLWERGKPVDIGNFGGVAWNTPMAISDNGVVVGFANSAEAVGDAFDYRAFIWTRRGGFRALPPASGDVRAQALGINDRGQAVGLSRGTAGLRAVLWQDGAATDLNALTPSEYKGHLVFANDINDAGVITGQAIDAAGEAVAFVATPKRS